MKEYVKNILPRLKVYSNGLNRKELFVDKPWVFFDGDGNRHKYIFKRGGELIMSISGSVIVGKWELLAADQSILIDRVTDKILLNQYFVDDLLMVLNLDGLDSEFMVLANEVLGSVEKIEQYLIRQYYERQFVVGEKTSDGQYLEIPRTYYHDDWTGSRVTLNGQKVDDAEFILLNKNRRVTVSGGIVKSVFSKQSYPNSSGNVEIEHAEWVGVRVGDRVYLDGNIAPDGKYRITLFKCIKVVNGVVESYGVF